MKNTWSLYKWQYLKDYPSVWYLWIDETNTVKFMRSVEPCGFMPSVAPEINIGDGISELRCLNPEVKKVYKHKMTDEELKRGWLILQGEI